MDELLRTIQSPADLKKLSDEELNRLAEEIRHFLLETVAQTGGHLASNLGVVELTLALHTVFDSPTDAIIWDVGHQSYIHKILTGRLGRFETLRQFQGISGFPKPDESPYDAFAVGHSSTSISVALGFAKARDLKGEQNKVVAVLGDGSLGGGMAFEGLNHLGHEQTDMIIVLNDNEMSISKNVGALSRYLTKLRMNPRLRRLKSEAQDFVKKIPRIGETTVYYLKRLEDSITALVSPAMLFEELGINYLGPIDGHNITALKRVFEHASGLAGPIIIHVLTTKGKGYEHAEQNPQKFHGTGPFEVSNGKRIATSPALSYSRIFGETLAELAQEDKRILAITAAMTDGTGLLPFCQQYPERFFDVGIAEQHAVTLAAGLAKNGFRPVVAVYSTFLQRAFDQIIHDVCLQNLPVLFMLDRAGLVGPDGPTHHGAFDLSYLRQIPNMTVLTPRNGDEFRDQIYTALQINGPVAIRYPKQDDLYLTEGRSLRRIPLGEGEALLSGKDAAILAVGTMVDTAMAAAVKLQKEGLECAVADARFIKPLDEKLILKLAGKHQRLITIEENVVAGGFGSAVAELLARKGVAVELRMLGLPDHFVDHGDNETLLGLCGLDVKGIVKAVRKLVDISK
jgi:1-deoxy-D-xylulose-5-phosphate synthase